MLNKLNTSAKLYLLIFITAASLIGLGFYAITYLKKMNDNTSTLYSDRIICMQELSNIRRAYRGDIRAITQSVKKHELSFSDAIKRIQQAQESIDTNWRNYKRTNFTPEEKALVKQTDILKNKADEANKNLIAILTKEDTLEISKLVQNEDPAAPSPFAVNVSRLIDLQVEIAKEILNDNKTLYKITSTNFILFIALSLVVALALSFYIIKNVRGLIKDLLRSNNEIRESEQKYHSLLENASDAIYLADVDGNFVDVNESMCKITGYSREELLKLNIADIIDPGQLKADPVIPFETLPEGHGIIRERRIVRKDGAIFYLENNIKRLAGNQVLVITRDITGRKRMEAELRDAELKFRTLVEKSMVGVYIVQNGKFIYVNPRFANVFGYEPKELINTGPVETVIHESYREIATEFVRRRVEGETESVHYEAMGRKKDGTANWVEFYGSTTIIGEEPTIIGSMIDITERKQIGELILKEKKLSETIINSLPGIFYLRNDQGKLVRWNENVETVTGYTGKEIEALLVRDMIAPEDHQIMAQSAEKVFTEGYAVTEAHLLLKDGRRVPFLFTGVPVIYEQQLCLLGTGIDISQRLKAEEELRLSEQKYKFLFDSNPLPLWMIARDDLSFIAVNDATASLYGYTKEEILNLDITRIRPKEDVEKQRELLQTEVEDSTYRGVTRHVKKDGSIIYVNVIVSDILFEGRKVRLGLTIDITEKLQAEELLKKSEANLKTIMDTTDTAYALLDRDLKLIAYNQMAVKFVKDQYDHDIVKGDRFSDYFPSERFPQFLTFSREVLKGKKVNYEINYPQADGSVCWYDVILSSIANHEDEIFGLMISLSDITDRKNSEMHLHQLNESLKHHTRELAISNKELEQFAYVASHDLQEPLRMVTSFMAQLQKKYGDVIDDKGKQYIHFAIDGAKRMRQIILDLLDFSRVGSTADELEEVDFNKLVNEVLPLFRRKMEEVKASVSFENLPTTQAYKTPMRQVFQNLIDNGLKYHKPGYPVTISINCKETKTHFQFSVKDNGIGIAPEYFDKIFIIFQRLHQKEEYSGTGMGLAITKKIIENLGGKIWVESEEGRGSIFYFTILKSKKK